MPASDKVFEVAIGPQVMTLDQTAVRQMLVEFIDTACFAEAYTTDRELGPADVGKRFVQTFSNERSTWR